MHSIRNIFIIILISNIILASCGGCPGDATEPQSIPQESKTSINALVTVVPKDGNVEGIVITSCGTCNLGVNGRGCSLSIKIGDTVYPVKGTSIHDHGDEHSKEGFCSSIRVAWAKGKIKDNTFHSESFVLVGSSN